MAAGAIAHGKWGLYLSFFLGKHWVFWIVLSAQNYTLRQTFEPLIPAPLASADGQGQKLLLICTRIVIPRL